MMCDECATDIELQDERCYIRVTVFGPSDAFERVFCSAKCMRDYTAKWEEWTELI